MGQFFTLARSLGRNEMEFYEGAQDDLCALATLIMTSRRYRKQRVHLRKWVSQNFTAVPALRCLLTVPGLEIPKM